MSKKNSKFTKTEVENVIETSVEETVVETVEEEIAAPTKSVGTVVNCSKLNVRKKPSIKANIVKVVNAGTKFEIGANRTDEWVEVEENGKSIGYCMAKYIKIS